jgi:hypothetical protein
MNQSYIQFSGANLSLSSLASITPRSDVVACALDTGQVLLDLATGNYFVLNATGNHVWSLLLQGTTFQQLQAAMIETYDVPADVLEAELEALLADLQTRNLISIGAA